MSSSWHNFLFASLDPSGVMTVDKPPLALWVQALSVRVFGYHPLSVLVPQALMGVASVVLVYDLVRRRFGRLGGFVAGLALATDADHGRDLAPQQPRRAARALLRRGAVVRGARRSRTGARAGSCSRACASAWASRRRWASRSSVVPGIVAAWLWIAPRGRGRLHALRQLLAGGAAMVLVGGAWPLLVELTPAADRPWVSGTSDNSVLSLIFEYNGLGRVDGQAGGAGAAAAAACSAARPGRCAC